LAESVLVKQIDNCNWDFYSRIPRIRYVLCPGSGALGRQSSTHPRLSPKWFLSQTGIQPSTWGQPCIQRIMLIQSSLHHGLSDIRLPGLSCLALSPRALLDLGPDGWFNQSYCACNTNLTGTWDLVCGYPRCTFVCAQICSRVYCMDR